MSATIIPLNNLVWRTPRPGHCERADVFGGCRWLVECTASPACDLVPECEMQTMECLAWNRPTRKEMTDDPKK